LPWNDRFDRRKGVDSPLPRGDQGGTYLGEKPHFVVDGFALFGKSPLILVLRLREEAADQPVMQLQNLVRQRRRGLGH